VLEEPRLSIDRASGLPIYLQIKYQVINDISMGRLIAGQVLPSIRQAAKQLGVTRWPPMASSSDCPARESLSPSWRRHRRRRRFAARTPFLKCCVRQ
jgi:DNA-binding transcriptional MocR family regulator